jgi:hypothetical protein
MGQKTVLKTTPFETLLRVMKKVCRNSVKSLRCLIEVLLIGLLICGIFSFNARAQQNKKSSDVTDGCEIVTANLGAVLNALNKIKDDENYLIIIGKSSSERSSRYIRRQVADVLKYFNFAGKIDKNKTAIGFGKSSNKFNQFQFFVGGKLVAEIKYHPTGKLCFSDGWTF